MTDLSESIRSAIARTRTERELPAVRRGDVFAYVPTSDEAQSGPFVRPMPPAIVERAADARNGGE